MKKLVYSFEEGNKEMKSLLGGKGANLAEMKKIGLPVPQGFTVTTEACNDYYKHNKVIIPELEKSILEYLKKLEKETKKGFGLVENPLLVSVRSGSVISMPGMMDTVLNLGLNDETVEGLAVLTGNYRFAYDSYRRFIQMFSDVVLGIHKFEFDRILEKVKGKYNLVNDTELNVDQLKELITVYKKHIQDKIRRPFPTEPIEQLNLTLKAVFDSWNNPRAIIYRDINDIPNDLGTAVTVQSMVFGNMGETSGTGVAFTRNPSTGENELFGEFLLNAQGEDVVAGIRTPNEIKEMAELLPDIYLQFEEITKKLEKHYKDMQDIEFTIEKGKLFLLQTRTGKRTAKAALEIAVDMVKENLIDKETAIMRIEPEQIDQLLHPVFDEDSLKQSKVITKGLPASPGAATGKVYFTSEKVAEAKANGIKSILVRTETSPEDISGMVAAEGILTARGGMTSHAAVVARGMGKCCVAGCGDVKVEEYNGQFRIGDILIKEGDFISLDGNTGDVYKGEVLTKEIELSGSFKEVMEWADEIRTLKIRTNAENPRDAAVAVKFGAEGIGLCRTEHMFFEEDRITSVRQMIISNDVEERQIALERLLPFQREDFVKIFEVMAGRPVTIRLLDPPLHEFLPHTDEELKILSEELKMDYNTLIDKVEKLNEVNPMLGHRGCRLAITFPEIYRMQTRAIFEAIAICELEKGINVEVEIMIPLVGFENELKILNHLVKTVADEVIKEKKLDVRYKIGTMIEVPRAALVAEDIAKHAEFFSFGTNDLTQMTLGFSRDDSGKFIGEYKNKEVFEKDPFERLDQKGVGKLMELAIEGGKITRPEIKLGICGEHGGEPTSIDFCHRIGLEYVSCSPFRVPIARLSSAQAVIRNK